MSVGLTTLWPGRQRLPRDLGSLAGRDRFLLALHGGLGLFLGPVATFLALDSLSVISQTLLFALVLYGPQHFLLLRLWWVVGVIVVYGLALVLAGLGLDGATRLGQGQSDRTLGRYSL
jgi:hypothetical protein